MAADDIERLFQRFEQAKPSSSQHGAGLGLAICQELTALMDGRIDVCSKPGCGSTFRVILPLAIVPADTRGELALPVPCAPRRACDVLVVDDDAVVGDVIAGLLATAGHRATVVPHALAALSAMEQGNYALALLDLDLPGVDGYALARMLRRLPQHQSVPLVGVSARSMGDEPRLTREAGMRAFLRKPVSGSELTAVLAGVLPGA
jgi:CheY-like chemotaxis protein